MPRALWNGSLSFGLVNVPVALVSATRNRDVRMRELDSKRGVPVSVRRICTAEDKAVPAEEVAHGLKLDGQEEYVMLTDEELAAAQPRRTDTIEIERFVDVAQIDPVMYDRSYWLSPTSTGEGPVRAYRLLVDAMSASGRAAIGEAVIHNREHPVVVRTRDQRMMLSTLLFSHEIRETSDLEIPALEVNELALQRMIAVIEELSTDFQPTRYHDRHRARLEALIESKLRGQEIERAPEPPAPEPTPDLIGALEESLAAIRGQGATKTTRRGTSRKTRASAQRDATPRKAASQRAAKR